LATVRGHVTLRRNLSIGAGDRALTVVARARRKHARLAVRHHATSSRERRSRWVVHGAINIRSREASSRSLLHPDLVALGDLALELLATDLTALSERHVERLGADHLVVHFSDGLGCFIGRGEADESETLGLTLLVPHDLAAGDGPERLEFSPQLLVINVILQVFDVEVDALVLAELLHLRVFVRPAKLLFTLGLLLSAGNKELLAIDFSIVEFVNGLLGLLMRLVVDETKALALALLINGNNSRGDVAVLPEESFELVLCHFSVEVLDVQVGELGPHFIQLGLTLLQDANQQ
jgi:hypothetical protein